MAFLPLGNSDHVFVSVSIDFPSNSQQDAPFHHTAYDYLNPINFCAPLIFMENECAKINSVQNRPSFAFLGA